ncbi:MAG: hypothetical protein ABEI98_01575 [Halorhabdus sp.]
MVDPADYIANWPSSGTFWEKVSSGSLIPTIRLGKLGKGIVGGLGLASAWGVVEFIRQGAINLGSLVAGFFDFGATIVTRATNIPAGDIMTAGLTADQFVQSEGVLGFVWAFLAMIALASVFYALVWGARRVV